MITDVEQFFAKGCGRCARFGTPDCSTRLWAEGLRDLRALCRGAGLEETAKWGHPCYVHKTRNIAIIGSFRSDFRLTFFNAALLKDPWGVLENQGPNTRHAGVIRFADAAKVTELAPVIRACLAEAISYAEAGIVPAKEVATVDLPDALIEALDADPELAEAFHALTPGRQRSYALNLNAAKKPETRQARIIGFRSRILAGKGATER
ncbi:MAG: YdeI/OmpD-associated family protein [Paracoccaceae bacterium]